MLILRLTKRVGATLAFAVIGVSGVHAADQVPVLLGKNDWLFTPYEFANPTDAASTQASIQAFERINKLFERKGIALALVIVPSKIRIHADQLPDDKPLDAYTNEKYEKTAKLLQDAGLNVVNLNQAFLKSPNRTSDTPIFLRLDTHWSPTGALLAAETIRSMIDSTPSLKAAWASTPEVRYTLEPAAKKSNTRARDLVRYLPKDAQTYTPERILWNTVTRASASKAGLQGPDENVGITVIGSSYTNKNTGYPDSIRYTLQRDLLDISLPVDQGPWYGMEAYLKDEAFKTNKPKLIIWEVPERELRSPPSAKYRDARYVIDNDEWYAHVSALLK
ncbi:MAG: hypothetical protein GZ085_08835 [Sulfuriferula multivorans]|uniref:AlgX/AlgJ SGNH hydrolase-like domain-containing protein n=1 Tax=Sulfuriferula multivorans TaxID=1559896 RepID=A0A7C9JY44_9PROT|nr:hypothetical protein [Sulfuriferula multivorans]